MIVDNQYSRPSSRSGYAIGPSESFFQELTKWRIRRCGLQHQCHGKGRPASNRTLNRNIASHQLRQPANYGQSKPCTTVAPRCRTVGLSEGLKQASALLIIEANPCITHSDCDV